MSKIVVSKNIFDELEFLTKHCTHIRKYGVISKLFNNVNLSGDDIVIAITAYLNEDGYEVEKTIEELAHEMYDSVTRTNIGNTKNENYREIGFFEGMIWMDENFKLGLNLKDR